MKKRLTTGPQKRQLTLKIIAFAGLALMAIPFQNCAKTPKVELASAMSAVYAHSGSEQECLSCHGSQRPSSTAGFLGFNQNAPFNQNNHGNGMDCIECHGDMPVTTRTSVNWANGFFQHKVSLSSCSECHSSVRPAFTAGGGAHPATGECFSCHTPTLPVVSSLTSANYPGMDTSLWKGANGQPTVAVWDPAKDLTVAVKTPSYDANGTLLSWASANQAIHMPMNHQATLAGVDLSQCATCHSNTSNYLGGRLHSSLTARALSQPTACASCHNSSQSGTIPSPSSGSSTVAFVGPQINQNTSTNPSLMNHVSTPGFGECSTCHNQSSWAAPTWKMGQYHLTTNVPSTCQDCHKPTRPTGLVGNFNHAVDGKGECAGCHTSTKTILASKTITGSGTAKLQVSDWAGAVTTPNGLVGSTQISVQALQLVSNAGVITGKTSSSQSLTLQFNHAAYQTNCSSCHAAGTYSGAQFHAKQSTQPTTCKTCHTSALEGFILGPALGKYLDHQHASVSVKDCSSCHTSPTATTSNLLFKDGNFHSTVGTQPTSCRDCHSPKILDQPVWGSMNHATIGTDDCAKCHSFPGTGGTINAPTWKGAMGGLPSQITLSPPTGQNLVGLLTIPHPAMKLTGMTCASCHGASTSSKIIGYDHANPPVGIKCVYCHYSGQVVTSTPVITKGSHKVFTLTGTNDCKDCHSPRLPTWNSTTGTWSDVNTW